jgi:hypothetical protein
VRVVFFAFLRGVILLAAREVDAFFRVFAVAFAFFRRCPGQPRCISSYDSGATVERDFGRLFSARFRRLIFPTKELFFFAATTQPLANCVPGPRGNTHTDLEPLIPTAAAESNSGSSVPRAHGSRRNHRARARVKFRYQPRRKRRNQNGSVSFFHPGVDVLDQLSATQYRGSAERSVRALHAGTQSLAWRRSR